MSVWQEQLRLASALPDLRYGGGFAPQRLRGQRARPKGLGLP